MNKTHNELASDMGRGNVEYIRSVASLSDEQLENDLSTHLLGRETVGLMVTVFFIVIPKDFHTQFVDMLSALHHSETSIAIILAERERRL